MMDWTQFTTFMIANVIFTLTLWLWSRGESRSDMRNMQNIMEAMRSCIEESRRETASILRAIQEESKDFHGRLCSIESRRK